MTMHRCRTRDPDCFRCELAEDELEKTILELAREGVRLLEEDRDDYQGHACLYFEDLAQALEEAAGLLARIASDENSDEFGRYVRDHAVPIREIRAFLAKVGG